MSYQQDIEDPMHSSDDDQPNRPPHNLAEGSSPRTDKTKVSSNKSRGGRSTRRGRGKGEDSSSGEESKSIDRKSRSRSPAYNQRRGGGGGARHNKRHRGSSAQSDSQSSDLNDDDNKSSSSDNNEDRDSLENKKTHHRSRADRGGSRGKSDRKKSSKQVKMPSLEGPFVQYKSFIEMQRDSLSSEDAQKFYDQYKADYKHKQAQDFFIAHRDECWFREQYDPLQSYKWKQEIMQQSQLVSQKFIEEFVEGMSSSKAQTICLDEDANFDYQKLISTDSDEVSGSPLYGFDANLRTLYLKQIPVRISRWDLLEQLRKTPGFVSFSMSEPLKTHDFERYAWVSYDSEENCRHAKEQLDGLMIDKFKLYPVKSQIQRKPIRITPPLVEDSIQRDFELCKRLISEKFDTEKKIPSSAYSSLIEICMFLSQTQQLDLLLLYLRKVHSYCFYCGEEYDDERMLAAKCGPQHIRNTKKVPRYDYDNFQQYFGSKSFEDKYLNAANERLKQGAKELQSPDQDSLLISIKEQYAQKKTQEVTKNQIYACLMCQKRFKSPEFVQKHIFNKHAEELDEKFNKSIFEKMLKENYMNDPNKFTSSYYQTGQSSHQGGGYGRSGDRRGGDQYKSGNRYGDHGGNRYDRGGDRDDRRRKEYVDYDDPSQNAKVANPERQIVSYDDLF